MKMLLLKPMSQWIALHINAI